MYIVYFDLLMACQCYLLCLFLVEKMLVAVCDFVAWCGSSGLWYLNAWPDLCWGTIIMIIRSLSKKQSVL